MAIGTCILIGSIVGIVLTVLVYVFIMPKAKEGKLGKFPQFLRDVFTFKKLFIESVLRFFYILDTLMCVGIGFFMLFGQTRAFSFTGSSTKNAASSIISGIASGNAQSAANAIGKAAQQMTQTKSTFLSGLLIMILGPIILRITFELVMMTIILVRNVKDINSKLGTKMNIFEASRVNVDEVKAAQTPVTPVVTPVEPTPPPAPTPVVTPVTPVEPVPVAPAPAQTICPNCGAEVSSDQKFCMSCGTQLN